MKAHHMDALKIPRREFVWHGLGLHLGRKPVLTLVQDDTHPHLYCIRYPNGSTSSPANLSRAKDAAYGHARHLLITESASRGAYSPEEPLVVPRPYPEW